MGTRGSGIRQFFKTLRTKFEQPGDFVGCPLNRKLERVVTVDVILRHILRGMAQHGADRQFREPEFAGHTAECVPQCMRRNAFQLDELTDTLEDRTDGGKRSV